MLAQSRQKGRERVLLERFLVTAGLWGEVVKGEREAPGFLIRLEDRLIGVEVSELSTSHGSTSHGLQVQEDISSLIVNRAQCIYRWSGGAPAHVTVCFRPGVELRHLSRETTAVALASFVSNLNLTPWQRFDWRPGDFDHSVPDEVAFIHALGVPRARMSHWSTARPGWVAPLTRAALQARIAEHEKQLPACRSVVPENWLLLVADRTRPSQSPDLYAHSDANSITSAFSRTFLYGYPFGEVIELGEKKRRGNKSADASGEQRENACYRAFD